MAIIICRGCGKVCAASHGELCAACCQRRRQAEVKVSEYLDAHPQATLTEIQHATGVERHEVTRIIQAVLPQVREAIPVLITGGLSPGGLCTKGAGQALKLLGNRLSAKV